MCIRHTEKRSFMLDKLAGIEKRYEELHRLLLEVGNDYQRAAELNKERLDLEPMVEKSKEYRRDMARLEEARAIAGSEEDAEMRLLAESGNCRSGTTGGKCLKKNSSRCLCPRTRATIKMCLSKSAPERVGRKQPFSPPTCIACIRVMLNARAGKSS